MEYFLGIDVGTTGCKVVLVNEKGELISKAVAEYPHTPTPTGEQDPADWWQGTVQAVKEALQMAEIDLSGTRSGTYRTDARFSISR